MLTIKISQEVWDEIAKNGNFGETEDDVLRRVFGIEKATPIASQNVAGKRRGNLSTNTMGAVVKNGMLDVQFADGKQKQWLMPNKGDKEALRKLRTEAVNFALSCGATKPGQTNAVLKAITTAGYKLRD